MISSKKRISRLVIGLNCIDNLVPNSWDMRLNLPNEEAEREIERRCENIIKKLSNDCSISKTNFVYYSALKKYNLYELLNTIIINSRAGFKFGQIRPRIFADDVAPDVKKTIEKLKKSGAISLPQTEFSLDKIKEEFGKLLSKEDYDKFKQKLENETKEPPKIAVLGKAGVGKTTTVNNLFNSNFETGGIGSVTQNAQIIENFNLPDGGKLTVVDLPGYGRTIEEDEKNETIYQEFIPQCDIVLLIIQATTKDFSDDLFFLNKMKTLLMK